MNHRKIFKWIIIVFIIIAVLNARHSTITGWAIKTGTFLHNFIPTKESTTPNTTSSETTSFEKKDTKPLITPVDNSFVSSFAADVINKFFDTPNGKLMLEKTLKSNKTLEVRELKNNHIFVDKSRGIGDKTAQCGDTVTISYEVINDPQAQKPKTTLELTIGINTTSLELESAILGMHQSGIREVYLEQPNQNQIHPAQKKYFTTIIEMLKLPDTQSSQKNFRSFIEDSDKNPNYIKCGQNIKLDYQLYNLNGKLLNEGPIALNFLELNQISKNVYNTIVNKNLINLKASVIMSYNDTTSLISTLPKEIPDSKPDELVILDLSGPKA